MILPLYVAALAATALSYQAAPWASGAALLLISGASLGGALRSRLKRIPLPAIGMASVGLVGVVQIASGKSAEVQVTLAEILQWFVLAAAFTVASFAFEKPAQRRLFLQLFAAAAGVVAAFAIVQPFAANLGASALAASTDRMVGPFRNRNTYAAFVELAFPPALWAAARVAPEWWPVPASLLVSALATGSRAGAALLIAETIILSLWLAARLRRRALAAALVGLIAASLFPGGATLRTRLGYDDLFEHRREIYASSIELLRQRPILGWGLGTFQAVYPAVARFDVGATVNHVHNDWLESAVEGGIAGIAALAGCVLLILWRARGSIWALGLPIVLLHALVDFPFQRIGVSIWFVLLAAAAWAQGTTHRSGPPGSASSSRRRSIATPARVPGGSPEVREPTGQSPPHSTAQTAPAGR